MQNVPGKDLSSELAAVQAYSQVCSKVESSYIFV